MSYSFKKILALLITKRCVKNFVQGEKPLSDTELGRELDIPMRLMRLILFDLVEAGILIEIKNDQGQVTYYQPARSVEALTIQYVIERLEKKGDDNIPIKQTDDLKDLKQRLEAFHELMAKSRPNAPLKDI